MTEKIIEILKKAVNLTDISPDEGLLLFKEASLSDLILAANTVRQKLHPNKIVSYIVDRNINLTNVCYSQCMFCNFCRKKNDADAYVLTIEEFKAKIDELYQLGGNQILLQGGMNTALDLKYYISLFETLKNIYPDIKLHALGPAEVIYLSNKSHLPISKVLETLRLAGLDSLPGAGAEILSDRVRKIISPIKCTSAQWLDVMHEAHKLNITTSATMMFGHLETIEERISHLVKIRKLQARRPLNSKGFISFTLWPFASQGTKLLEKHPDIKPISQSEFLRMLTISRLMLLNIENIQASWLTMGGDIAQVCLTAGANDLSSIMIEENVVSKAGKQFTLNEEQMQNLITQAGFEPRKRNQEYE
jgi:cyclic dehypoxanthinyl futalosine synthase